MQLKVEEWPIERFVQYTRNPRKNDGQVGRMADAIREFGFRIPVVAKSDGTLVDGHLRLKSAKALGMKTIPVALADDLTDDQIRAFRLLANKSATWAEWDEGLLSFELGALEDAGFDIGLTGFDLGEETEASANGPVVKEVTVDTSELQAQFWVSIRGPLSEQARTLDAIKTALGEPSNDIEIDIGVIA
jgi:ParB-like chromosome segregation protein Spo0J